MKTLQQAGVTLPSPFALDAFQVVAKHRLRKGFRAVRALHADRLRQLRGPAVISLNHPSWWDPLLCFYLAHSLMPQARHFAPISAASLQKYGLFRKLGMFPVEQHTPRGAAQFLRAGRAVLELGGILWVTSQGSFTDARERPPALKPGLGALLERSGAVNVLTMAVEYPFWNDRLPEAVVSFQEARSGFRSGEEWTRLLTEEMAEAQDELARAARTRSAAEFETLLDGSSGSAGVYGVWQKLSSRRGDTGPAEG